MKSIEIDRIFAREWFRTGHQRKAWEASHPKSVNYPERIRAQNASRFAKRPGVVAEMNRLHAKAEATAIVTRNQWLERLVHKMDSDNEFISLRAMVEYGKAEAYYPHEKVDVANTVEAVEITPEERWERICGIFGVDPATTPRRGVSRAQVTNGEGARDGLQEVRNEAEGTRDFPDHGGNEAPGVSMPDVQGEI